MRCLTSVNLYYYLCGHSTSPNQSAVGDVNGDGKLDLVLGSDAVYVLLGNGDGTFGAASAAIPSNLTTSRS